MCLNNSQNVANLLLLVFSHVGMKITESFVFFFFSNLLQGSRVFISQLPTKIKTIKIFHESQINRKVKALLPDPGGSLKVYADFGKYGCQHVAAKICQGGCE